MNGKECYIMARPCFVLFLRFLRSRSFFLLYLLSIHTNIYKKNVEYGRKLFPFGWGFGWRRVGWRRPCWRAQRKSEERPRDRPTTTTTTSNSLSEKATTTTKQKGMRAKQ